MSARKYVRQCWQTRAGCRIEQAIGELLDVAKETGKAQQLYHNEIDVYVRPDDTVASAARRWWADSERRRDR